MPPTITDDDRKRLLAEVRALAGAALQKLWLPSAQVCVLQFREPAGRLHDDAQTAGSRHPPAAARLVVLDARLGIAAVAPSRPTSPESAPRSQATLRNALASARLSDASLLRSGRVQLKLETEKGPRALIAEHALLLVDATSRKILWASSGAERRPGTVFPELETIALGDAQPLAQRDELVQSALQGEEAAGFAARQREVVARLKSRAQKLKRTLAAVEEDSARAARADADRARAELLLPFASKVPRGAREARVPDWSKTDAQGEPAEAVIELDPALSAAENAARWLKKAKRYQAAGGRIAARRSQVSAELARAEELLAEAQSARDAGALALVEAEGGKAAAPRARAQTGPRLPYRKFLSRSGAPILVGRSARDNDALLKSARGNDLWLHVRGTQGAHVLVPGAADPPDARTLGDAALLAAHFSSARGEEAAEIAWTRCKYVRKPRGAKPGSVMVTQERTLLVRPDADRLRVLLQPRSPKAR